MSKQEIFTMIKEMAEFPFSKICKHSVSLKFLSILESKGINFDIELAKAICDSDDEQTLKIIEGIKK
jgi:hypothetical protein